VRGILTFILAVAVVLLATPPSRLVKAQDRGPTATLIPAMTISLSGSADSNSPLVWDLLQGRDSLFVLTSFDGWPSRQAGNQLQTLAGLGRIAFATPPPHGVWMEAIVRDDSGRWYGYYHNERPAIDECGDSARVLPRIGAARSDDFGATWEDLGLILEAPPEWHDCDSSNRYFVGGVGDFSVMLDDDRRYLYLFFSQYADREQTQGVAVARMPWAFRDRPRGRLSVWWHGSTWVPARLTRVAGGWDYTYSAGMPIYRARDGWHEDQTVDAFWGPAVHWNTYLEQYVMLLNHAHDTSFRQEGIYIAFSRSLDDPSSWSEPRRLLMGGEWYPQVVGIEPGTGTDKIAGERARLFIAGRSRYFIQFAR
jgi:hypothetical protein